MKHMAKKKAFTIVELVIVIAIIAVLAAVLVPTFTSVVKKAKVSNDTQLVKNLNTALAADAAVNGKHATMQSALDAAFKFGYDVSKINATANGNEILWDSANDVFCYLKDGTVEYIPDSVSETNKITQNSDFYKLWKIYGAGETVPEAADQQYSIYLNGASYTVDSEKGLVVTVGFDAGTTTGITAVTYDRSTANDDSREVVICTNGGTLTLNAPNDSVERHGYCDLLDIQAIKSTSMHEYGTSAMVAIASGRVVFEIAESTGVVFIASNNAIIAVAKDVEVPEVRRAAEVTSFKLQSVTKEADGSVKIETETTFTISGSNVTTETKNASNQTVQAPANVKVDTVIDTVQEATSEDTVKNENVPSTITSFAELKSYIEGDGVNGVLGANITSAETLIVESNKVIDLNGYTITATLSGGRLFKLVSDCKSFTINGQKENSALVVAADATTCYGFVDMNTVCEVTLIGGSYSGAGNAGSFIRLRTASNGSNLNLINCTMETTGVSYGFINSFTEDLSELNVIGGTYIFGGTVDKCGPFECSYYKALFKDVTCIAAQGPIIESSLTSPNAGIIVENCNFGKPVGGQSWDATAVAASNGNSITINNGTYWGTYAAYTYNSGGTININNGDYKGSSAALKADGGAKESQDEAYIYVSNGTFNGKVWANGSVKDAYIIISGGTFSNVDFVEQNEKSHIIISGGTFDKDPTSYLAENYKAVDNGNGTWTVFAK